MDLYGENKIDIENKATNTEYMEYILAEPYVDEVLYERKAKKQNISEMRGKREKEIMNLVDEEIDNWNEDNWKDYIVSNLILIKKCIVFWEGCQSIKF